MSNKDRQPVVITTQHRGVFFGWADPEELHEDTIRLTQARNCIAWQRSIGGVLGLAQTGPNPECKIGAVAPALQLRDITAVVECSPVAAKAWSEAPCVS
jgi:hypothetical protein